MKMATLNGSLFPTAMTTIGFQITNQLLTENPEENLIPLKEVSWHDNSKDCWIVIYDRVYNVTKFLDEHPGGSDILLEYAGRDATLAFRGFGHSGQALRILDRYFIGELPIHERIFRKPEGYHLSDIPK